MNVELSISDEQMHIKSFDGLRFIAVFMVFLTHMSFLSGWRYEKYYGRIVAGGGPGGVSLCIFLSAFLLTIKLNNSKCDENDKTSLRTSFWTMIKRIRKFYSLHILTFVVIFPLAAYEILLNSRKLWLGISMLFNLLLLHAYVPISRVYFSFNAVSWYLSACTFFYFVHAFFIKIIKRIDKYMMVLYLCIVGIEILICTLLADSSLLHAICYINPIYRSLDFLLGCICGAQFKKMRYNRQIANIDIRIATIIEIVVVGLYTTVHLHYLDIPIQYGYGIVYIIPVSLLLMVIGLEKGFVSRFLGNKIFMHLSKLSFEFYLIHKVVIRYLMVVYNKINGNRIAYCFSALLITLVCSELCVKYKEYGVNKC